MTPIAHLPPRAQTAVQMLRDGLAKAEKPVLLFSGGKAATVLAGLALKAFAPARPPLPLLYVDSVWAFREAREFISRFALDGGFELHIHQDGSERRSGRIPALSGQPFAGAAFAEALRQILDFVGYDVIFTGATCEAPTWGNEAHGTTAAAGLAHHMPGTGEPGSLSPAIFPHDGKQRHILHPLAGWREHDLWTVIAQETLPVCPLYFAAPRPTADCDGRLIVVDEPESAREMGLGAIREERVRLPSLGLWPFTQAIRSDAIDLPSLLRETLHRPR